MSNITFYHVKQVEEEVKTVTQPFYSHRVWPPLDPFSIHIVIAHLQFLNILPKRTEALYKVESNYIDKTFVLGIQLNNPYKFQNVTRYMNAMAIVGMNIKSQNISKKSTWYIDAMKLDST